MVAVPSNAQLGASAAATRREFLRTAGIAAMAPWWLRWPWENAEMDGPFRPPPNAELDPVAHVLQRVGFGARPGDYESVAGLAGDPREAALAWIERQLEPDDIDDDAAGLRVRRFESIHAPAGEMFEYKGDVLLAELTGATVLRAVYSRRQVFETMVQFWTDHFNIDVAKAECRWLKAADDRDVIRKHAFKNFPDLLRASASSPAMLWYLDGRVNRRESSADQPNENYARELLELHTLGVNGGYTQTDVMEVARCLTGWSVRDKTGLGKGKVEFHANAHDHGAKKVLGHDIPAGLGEGDLDQVLEIVACHPATARNIAHKLARRFIADDPPENAVATVAETFFKTNGDVRATLLTLFRHEAFWASAGGKIKRPFEFVVSALRASDAEIERTDGLAEMLQRLGHAPFQYPTPDGYPLEPEPYLGTLLWRWNFAARLAEGDLPGVRVDAGRLARRAGSDDDLLAHFLGRRPRPEERSAFLATRRSLALPISSPAFQHC
jgi:uncharacterized protein (DUF1800 family)